MKAPAEKAPASRPTYRQHVVERVVPAAREQVWDTLVGWMSVRGWEDGVVAGVGAVRRVPVAQLDIELVEKVLSFEPPWRVVYEIVAGAPVETFQGFIHLVPDPAGCLAIRSFLALPGADADASEAFFARAEATFAGWVRDLAAAFDAA